MLDFIQYLLSIQVTTISRTGRNDMVRVLMEDFRLDWDISVNVQTYVFVDIRRNVIIKSYSNTIATNRHNGIEVYSAKYKYPLDYKHGIFPEKLKELYRMITKYDKGRIHFSLKEILLDINKIMESNKL